MPFDITGTIKVIRNLSSWLQFSEVSYLTGTGNTTHLSEARQCLQERAESCWF